MITVITVLLMSIIPIMWLVDMVYSFIENAKLYIDDDDNAWQYNIWTKTPAFFENVSDSAASTYIIMTLIMVVGYAIGYAGATDAHNTAHPGTTNCFYWYVTTICHTIYIGSITIYIGSYMILNHLRAIRRLEKERAEYSGDQ